MISKPYGKDPASWQKLFLAGVIGLFLVIVLLQVRDRLAAAAFESPDLPRPYQIDRLENNERIRLGRDPF